MPKYIEVTKAADIIQSLVDTIEVILSETPIDDPWRQKIEQALKPFREQLAEWHG